LFLPRGIKPLNIDIKYFSVNPSAGTPAGHLSECRAGQIGALIRDIKPIRAIIDEMVS